MKFEGIDQDITDVLTLSRDIESTFELLPYSPIELREHLVEENGKIKVVDCLWNQGKQDECPFCITATTLYKHANGKDDFKKWYAKRVFFLPAVVNEKLYLFRFRNKIHDAYLQLMTDYDIYKFKGQQLHFNHKVIMKNGFPDYGTCSFSFNTAAEKKKKNIVSISVDKLCDDARRF